LPCRVAVNISQAELHGRPLAWFWCLENNCRLCINMYLWSMQTHRGLVHMQALGMVFVRAPQHARTSHVVEPSYAC
jgi:hypothetical protein